jgi:hypothetical protein
MARETMRDPISGVIDLTYGDWANIMRLMSGVKSIGGDLGLRAFCRDQQL